MFLKKMFRSITSLNDKIKQNKNGIIFEEPTIMKNVQKNYIAIGKLAKNADIKAEEVFVSYATQRIIGCQCTRS